MARIPKEKKRKPPKNHIYHVPLLTLEFHPDEEWEENGPRCDNCKLRAVDADDDSKWVICLGVSTHSTLEYCTLCDPCRNSVEWGDVYCPGGLHEIAVPVGA